MHFFMLHLREKLSLRYYNLRVNPFGDEFLTHMSKRYLDMSKLENIDAQIYFYNQEIRTESSLYNYAQVLHHLPKLIQVLKIRMAKMQENGPVDQAELNFYNYRLGVALQDLSMTKMNIGKPEDSVFHLQEAEKILMDVTVDQSRGLSRLLLQTTCSRNRDLFRKSQSLLAKKQSEKPLIEHGSEAAKLENRRQLLIKLVFFTSVFAVGYFVAKKFLQEPDSPQQAADLNAAANSTTGMTG